MLQSIAQKGKLSLGLVFPIEGYQGSVPEMKEQEHLAKLAEEIGFKALWFRDVPFHDPTFGDAGQMYDPWIYMTHMMHETKSIALATGSLILPLRHPVHTAKSLFSLQNLSGGRVILGVASGDRPIEFPAFGKKLEDKASLFRQSFDYLKRLNADFPQIESNAFGQTNGQIDILPKPTHQTQFLITGHSGQSLEWIAEHGDGWLYYPRNFNFLKWNMEDWHAALEKASQPWKPFLQSLYIDLIPDKTAHPTGIHLGFKSGAEYLNMHLHQLQEFGVNHVILNLKFSSQPIAWVLEELGKSVLPKFL